jgi:hypothetical protein
MSELVDRLYKAAEKDGDPRYAAMLREAALTIRFRDKLIDGLRKALEDVPLPSVSAGSDEFVGRFYRWYYNSKVPALAPFEDFDK